ncbi:hypothetical protein R1sor_003192 [Riccia sorocarpa]|uniref:Uncharacterized protein n=1 Tax=Riccia sorocarpa TaxID=122646 RepID=A0ABD3H0V6_9MARC
MTRPTKTVPDNNIPPIYEHSNAGSEQNDDGFELDSDVGTEAQENPTHTVEHQNTHSPPAEDEIVAVGEEALSETEEHPTEINIEECKVENSADKEALNGERILLQAQVIHAEIQSLVDANKEQESKEGEYILPAVSTKIESSNHEEENIDSSIMPRENDGMKWGDFPVESEDDDHRGGAATPAKEAEGAMENWLTPEAEAAAGESDEAVEAGDALEPLPNLNVETVRSLNPFESERDSTSYREEEDVPKERESARERLNSPVGEEKPETLNPVDNLVISAQKPLEKVLAVSDSQVKTGVWRRLTGGRTSRELASGDLTNMEGLELELANLIDEDPLQVAILPNILLNKNYSSRLAEGEEMEGEAAEEKEHPPHVGGCEILSSPLELPEVEGQVDATGKLSTEE